MKPAFLDFEIEHDGTFEAFRNIATCDPSQQLFDDISPESDWETLQYLDNLSSGIDHAQANKSRFSQYGRIEDSLLCFDEGYWSWGRFGARNYGVWYGALEEETSVMESLFHRPEIDKNDLKNTRDPIVQARRMFKAWLDPEKYSDLRDRVEEFPLLIDHVDYTFCQALGKRAIESGIDMLLAASVRKAGGTCTPVFNPNAITKDSALRTYFFHFPVDGSRPFFSSSEKI